MSQQKQLNELEVRQLLQSGSQADFAIIYRRYTAALLGVLVRITQGNQEQAEDILQEAFVKIWRNASSYNAAKGTVFTWMLNIARNLAIDKLRSAENSFRQKSFSLSDNVGMAEAVPDTLDRVSEQELKQLVNTLQPKYSTLINMIYIEGYTQAEVADQLQIPLGTVKTRVRAALQLLQTQLT